MNEPLRGKLFIDGSNGERFFYEDYVKSAVEFWYEYRDEPTKFYDDFEKEFKDFLVDELGYGQYDENVIYPDNNYIEEECKDSFNHWLFRYTFGDVTK